MLEIASGTGHGGGMFILTPSYIKEGRALLGAAHKLFHYRRDLWPEKKVQEFREALQALKSALSKEKKEPVLEAMAQVEKLAGKLAPPEKHAGWREHCEILLVAIVIAAGVRAYFVQPFKIPTGSMQPTLNGIISESTTTPFPNPVIRFLEFFILGRNYIEVKSERDETVTSVREKNYLNFFTFTEITTSGGRYSVFAPSAQLMQDFGIVPGRQYRRGDIMARGTIETGDQVFVDKISYHFAPPVQGDVFVFKTLGIRRIEMGLPPGVTSQHYIKRLAGMPGQELRISPPLLFINGRVPTQEVFRRVMEAKNGYRGYSNGMLNGFSFQYLGSPSATFKVPANTYFALGDNSYQSSDSRNWGPVPEKNVSGRGVMVYWPISARWGFIR